MRMEKINEHQVRCLISSQDLLQRKLTAGELRYGAPETRALFKEVLQKASQQYGFNKEEYPVMIEAVPVTEGLLIVLSAVENPEETDPHFVHFHEEDNEEAARRRLGEYEGESHLYRGEGRHEFFMVLMRPEGMKSDEFITLVNQVAEYSDGIVGDPIFAAKLLEHDVPALKNAVNILRRM